MQRGLREPRHDGELANGQVRPQRDGGEKDPLHERARVRTTAPSVRGNPAHELVEIWLGEAGKDEPRIDHHVITI